MAPQRCTPLTGVSLTALGVAIIRARESDRPDRLYDDVHARAFAEAARDAYFAPTGPPEAAKQWAQIEGLADQFYEGRSVGVRVVDDRILAWVASGGRQLVMLGAGLDTRAYRMDIPADVRWFELDLPELFEFKEPVLRDANAAATCDRRVIAVDLRTDWAPKLLAAGFDPRIPTAWIAEGAIAYLAHDDAMEVAAALTRLSAARSELETVHAQVDENQQRYRDLRDVVAANTEQPPTIRGLGPDAQHWLQNNGWRCDFRGWDDTVRSYGRSAAMTGDPDNGVIHAVRGADGRQA